METAKIVLEYVKVILSSQVIIGAVAVTFVSLFRMELAGLINRVLNIKFPGGELSMSQIEKTSGELSAKKEPPPVLNSEQTNLPQNLNLSPVQVKAIQELMQAQRAEAYLWEYRYLNYYLVYNTQRVLDWLSSLTVQTTVSFFDSFWMSVIPRANERNAIINALQMHHLIQINGALIEVTPKGKEYVQWRGASPANLT